MEKYELQQLRDLPIEGVAERLGLQVSRHKCLCPFHNDHHASMSFKVSKNTYRCFVCGESGGPIDLVMKYLRKNFLDACRWLADENNISAGHKAIAIPSATLLTKEVRGKMEEVRDKLSISFHMYPDCDAPGERLFLQLREVLPSLVHHQLPPGCKDFGDYYKGKQ